MKETNTLQRVSCAAQIATDDGTACSSTKEASTQASTQEPASTKDSSCPPNILIVDDDIIMLRTMTQVLKDNYRTCVAKSAKAGLEIMYKGQVDLVLLDYMMPVMNGYQCYSIMKQDEKLKHIPVFFLTGANDSPTIANIMTLSPAGYILKSTAPDELLARVDNFFFCQKHNITLKAPPAK